MIFWACSGLTLGAALVAAFVGDIRRAVLSLWIAGLGVGGLYLSMGAETLAIVQWIVETLVAIAFIFYTVMFGEFGVPDRRPFRRKMLAAAMPILLGVSFAAVVWLGAKSLPGMTLQEPFQPTGQGQDVAALGKNLADNHILSLEILGLMLFLVIVGSGVVARPEVKEP